MSNFPQHERLREVSEQSQAICEFLDWLGETKGLEISHYGSGDSAHLLVPANLKPRDLCAEFFGIDIVELEKEKQQIISEHLKHTGGSND